MTQSVDRTSAALAGLLERFGQLVRRVGFNHGLTEGDVDEVLQEVRIRIWKARADVAGDLPASYVHRTAVSAAVDIVRRRRSESRLTVPDTEDQLFTARYSGPDPQRNIEIAELEHRIGGAVERLTPSRRPVVRMYLQGYSQQEIATLLGWSQGKTRNLLYRGLADLRATLVSEGLRQEGG